jgi:hypothetical protein
MRKTGQLDRKWEYSSHERTWFMDGGTHSVVSLPELAGKCIAGIRLRELCTFVTGNQVES